MKLSPFTDDEVASMNAYQACGHGHPFTGRRGPMGEETILRATRDGWVEAEGGPVIQRWAHAWMCDWSWRK